MDNSDVEGGVDDEYHQQDRRKYRPVVAKDRAVAEMSSIDPGFSYPSSSSSAVPPLRNIKVGQHANRVDQEEGTSPAHPAANGPEKESKLELFGFDSLVNILGLKKYEPDPFDPAYLEEAHIKEGYDEGYHNGLVTGREEGRLVGLKDGFVKGEELGFYRGYVDVWNSAICVDPSHLSTRVQNSVKATESLLEKYPFMDPENEKIQDILNDLRLKFRAICASLGVKLDYEGYPGGGDTKDISMRNCGRNEELRKEWNGMMIPFRPP